jgi:hypothetical protein
MIDFNTEPYNDDYDENKKFYRILYRPSFAVQARELTQMQTILQNQISRHGSAIFKQGAMVIPGQCSVETVTNQSDGADYVTLQVSYNGVAVQTFVSSLEGQVIVGSSGLKATVIKAQDAEGTEPTTLYVRYLNSGTNNTTKVFANNEVIQTEDQIYSFQASASAATGKGSLATITRGVYYINGHFVLVEDQTIVLDKYSNTPSYRVGLQVTESIKTPEEDETLLDNAQNSYNFAAPGAHRYYIELTLSKLAIDTTEDLNFIELIRVVDGRIKTIVDKTDYSIIGETLARRTFDESGDYTVREFGIDVREHRNNNRGQWLQTTSYLYGDIVTNGGNTYVAKTSGNSVTTAPTHTSGSAYDGPGSTGIKWEWTSNPVYNRGIYSPADGGDATKLAIGIEAGKAYIRGYEIQKDSTTYVAVDKARDYAQQVAAVTQPSVGNYVLVTNVNNLPPIDTLETISLRDQVAGSGSPGTAAGNQIGTARVRFIEWHGGASYGATAVYKLGLFDIQMTNGKDFNRNVKSFYYSVSSGDPNVSFEADINPVSTPLIGSITAASNTITGVGTSFQTDLVVGDYIIANGTMIRVSSISDQNTLGATTGNFTGKAFALATTQLLETQNSSLVFPLPNTSVRSLRSAGTGGVNNATYITYQKFTQNASGTTLSLSTSGTFSSASGTTNYIVVDNDITTGGAVIQPVSIVPVGSSVTITLPSAQSNHSMTVIAAVQRTGSAFEKTKTLTSATETFTTQAAAQQAILYLDKADVLRITSIKMAPGSAFGTTPASSAYTLDISDRYDFDNGQRTSHYDWGSLILKPSFTAPSNPIQVTYEYFEHGVGDYFDVNSYSGVDYSLINPAQRDALDFRPRVANKSAGTTKNFISTGSSICGVPKRGENVTADYSYYLARRDKIAIDFNGKIFDIRGVPSTNPGDPQDPSQGMVIYNLSLNPYTLSASDLSFNKIDNKRYTMRDIGKLESRINNLEYYTSLSLLETDTQSMKLTDSRGMDRMKNGFVVDSFTGSDTIGDPTKVDYYCSIDKEKGQLRPFYVMQNVNLLEKNSNDIQRANSKYQLNGDIITLPIIDTPVLIKQDYASRLENINPFAIITFLGNVDINPPTDDWFETNTLPDPFVNNVEGNYNVIRSMAVAAGLIGGDNNFGIVWGPWRTDWIGYDQSKVSYKYLNQANTSRADLNAIGGDIGGGARRNITVQTVATPVGQARTGVKTTLKESYTYEQVGERTVSKTIIPYMRSRNLLIQVRGLKPQTRFYGYFDDIDVNAYITPAKKLVYTPTNTAKFDTTSNVGGSASETKRRIAGDSQVCLNKGDVITTSNNSGSAVVVGTHVDPDTGAYVLDIVNVIGTITNGQSFTGSVSGATGTVVSVTTPTTLVTDKNGDINLLFNIPNTNSVRFRTGGKEFKLIDAATSTGSWTSRGRSIYRAEGILETKQGVVNAVRNAELVREVIGPNDDPAARQTIYQTSDRVVSDSGWYDPLAQSFLVQQKGGAFLTGIDIFFATKDDRIPVTLEIREMVNGTPGKNVLPFSRVTLKPEQVNLSTNMVTLTNGSAVDYQVPTFDTPTRFTFNTPVYVQDNAEYCFVLQSDSNNYKVWVSAMGDEIPGTSGRTISQQPYAGVMFKSQNASTWTADQNQDIKFTIYRAQFDTTAVGNVQFVNDVLPYQFLGTDPFQTAAGSTTVRVWQTNHGMYNGSSVTIDGVASAVNGIPAAELNGTHVIGNVDKDCYTFTTTTAATSSGYGGGSLARGTKNINYDLVNPSIQMQTFSDTKCTFSISTSSGKSIDGTQTPYQQDTVASACLVKEDNFFDSTRVIASEVNENTLMGGNKSVTFTCLLSTTNDSVSPVVDTSRASLVAVSNIINYPTEANTNVAALDSKQLFTGATGAFSFTTTGFTSTNAAIRASVASIGIGRYITIASATTAGNNGTYLVTGYTDDGTTATITLGTNTSGGTFSGTAESAVSGTTVSVRELFYDEIAPDGSTTLSSFVTNPVKFTNPSTYLRIRFAANIPTEADVLVYYKTCTGDRSQLDTTKYTLMNPDSSIKKVELGDLTFTDLDYTLTNLSAFDTLVVKLVMKSTNSSAVPLIKDLRIISCP